MASINDWAAAAARYIHSLSPRPTVDRTAAIIVTFAQPILNLLHELRPPHSVDCPHGADEDEVCNCGANALNARIDAALAAPVNLSKQKT